MDVLPLNLSMIAAYYNISWTTLQTFSLSLTARTKMKGLLEIITSAAEFDDLPIRRHEDVALRRIYDRVPVKLDSADLDSPYFKGKRSAWSLVLITPAFVLVQAHFSRIQLPVDLAIDQTTVLCKILNLISACVDVMSSEGYLHAIMAMEMSQMVVQAIWDRDSPLLQLPHFNSGLVDKCKEKGYVNFNQKQPNSIRVTSIFELMDMEDDDRNDLLQMTPRQIGEVANFVNKYPNIEMSHEFADPENIIVDEPTILQVYLERDVDGEEEVDTVVSTPYFPTVKNENWWLVVSSESEILSIKRVTLQKSLSVKLDFVVPIVGEHHYKLTCMSDSYLGADQEAELSFTSIENTNVDGDDEEE